MRGCPDLQRRKQHRLAAALTQQAHQDSSLLTRAGHKNAATV
jgi:hypothetical protein